MGVGIRNGESKDTFLLSFHFFFNLLSEFGICGLAF